MVKRKRLIAPTAEEYSRGIRNSLVSRGTVRKPVRYYGGKGPLSRTLIPYLPKGRVYCEPYCGSAAMFWRLPEPWSIEILNDFDGELINMFRVLQDTKLFTEFAHRLTCTPYSFEEFQRARRMKSDNSVDRAWAFFVSMNLGFSGRTIADGNWSRSTLRNLGHQWLDLMSYLEYWHKRLMSVQLDNRDAIQVIEYWDGPDTVFYLDPPYVHGTRKVASRDIYVKECNDAHHRKLVKTLLKIEGQAMLSGYACDLYVPLEDAGWERKDFERTDMTANKAKVKSDPRTETVWIKYNKEKRLSLW